MSIAKAVSAVKDKRGLSEKIWSEHLMSNLTNILEVPDNIRKKIITEEIAYRIINENFSYICCIPPHILSKSFMCKIWSERRKFQLFDIDFFLKYSPDSLLDKKFCLECIANYPHPKVIQYFPSSSLTRKFWELALHLNGYLIKYIDKQMLNNKLRMIAVKNNAMAIKFIPVEFRNRRLSSISVGQDPRTIIYAVFK